jgi:hypothetical protein
MSSKPAGVSTVTRGAAMEFNRSLRLAAEIPLQYRGSTAGRPARGAVLDFNRNPRHDRRNPPATVPGESRSRVQETIHIGFARKVCVNWVNPPSSSAYC